MKQNFSQNEMDQKITNLRSCLARRTWDARNLRITTIIEIDSELRTLVADCPDEVIEQANTLYHRYKSKYIGMIGLKKLGCNEPNCAVKSRDVLMTSDMRKKVAA